MPKALEGIRVLDLTRVLSGPFCTAMLADMGAEVIKVENPDGGDMSREPSVEVNGESYYFMSLNRGKKGITLNLKDPQGVAVLKELAVASDVLVENFRPGVMDRLGLDWESLKAVNPRLIYASISGFGQQGPLSQRPAFDLIAQAMGGIMSINGPADRPPTRVGVSLGDTSTALYTAFAVVSALFARQRSGAGQRIDVAMVDSIFSLLEMALFQYLGNGQVPGRVGSRHPTSYPYDAFRAADGHFVVATFENTAFERLCQAMEMPELAQRPEFSSDTRRGRPDAAAELKQIIETWAATRTVADVVAHLEHYKIPVSPILDIGQVAESEHIQAREMLTAVDHPVAGTVRLPALPVKFSDTPAQIQGPSPLLGQDTDRVLAELLGYDVQRINTLRSAGVI